MGGGGGMLFHCRMHETEGQNFPRPISIEVVFWCATCHPYLYVV